MDLAEHGLAAGVRVTDGLDREERCLRLDVVHVGRVLEPGGAHRGPHPLGDLLDHGRPADVLGQELGAHGRADDQAGLAGGPPRAVLREHRGVGGDHPVTPSRPHHGDATDLLRRPLPVLLQHAPEGLVGENAREVVDAPVALGLADDGDHLVGCEPAGEDALLETGGVLDAPELDLGDLDGHRPPLPGPRVPPGSRRRDHAVGARCAISWLARLTASTMFW